MLSLVLSILLWNMLILILLIGISALRVAQVNWKWPILGLIVFSVCVFVNKTDLYPLSGIDISAAAKQLNIDGKWAGLVVALLATALVCRYSKAVTRHDIGLTLRQEQGSLLPSLLATGVALVVAIALGLLAKSGDADNSWLVSLSYPIVAGLDEELIYRGLLLALFGVAVSKVGFGLLGAKVTLGGLIALVLFAVIHGIRIKNGDLSVSVFGVGLTFFYGFIFLWIRERTGSLLLPIISHNLINTISWMM